MAKSLTPAQEYLLHATVRRAESVRKFAELSLRDGHLLPVVMAHGAWLLIRTLILLCGDSLQTMFFQWFKGTLRDEFGLCELCGKPKDPPDAVACPECLQEFEQQDLEADQFELMERAKPDLQ